MTWSSKRDLGHSRSRVKSDTAMDHFCSGLFTRFFIVVGFRLFGCWTVVGVRAEDLVLFRLHLPLHLLVLLDVLQLDLDSRGVSSHHFGDFLNYFSDDFPSTTGTEILSIKSSIFSWSCSRDSVEMNKCLSSRSWSMKRVPSKSFSSK